MTKTRVSNRQAVYAQIRRRILTLAVPPGAPLSENELAAELGVSRTPVREALILLADEGLVQVFPQVGTFASLMEPGRVRDAQFLREAVELASLRSMPQPSGLDAEVLARLRENLRSQQSPELASEDFFDLDEQFHRELMNLAGNAGVWPAVVSAKGHLDRARRLGMAHVRPASANVAEHRAVLDAVEAGDQDRAIEHLRKHLRAVLADIERIQELAPELFAGPGRPAPVRRSVVEWS